MATKTARYRVVRIRKVPGTQEKELALERVDKPINPKAS